MGLYLVSSGKYGKSTMLSQLWDVKSNQSSIVFYNIGRAGECGVAGL